MFSKASCYVKITEEQDDHALDLYGQYHDFYLDMVEKARSVSGEKLEKAHKDLDTFADIMVNHDPAMKILEKMTEEIFIERLNESYQTGIRLVEEIEKTLLRTFLTAFPENRFF